MPMTSQFKYIERLRSIPLKDYLIKEAIHNLSILSLQIIVCILMVSDIPVIPSSLPTSVRIPHQYLWLVSLIRDNVSHWSGLIFAPDMIPLSGLNCLGLFLILVFIEVWIKFGLVKLNYKNTGVIWPLKMMHIPYKPKVKGKWAEKIILNSENSKFCRHYSG